MNPLDVLVVVAPVFLVLGAGALATRMGWVGQGAIDGLMSFGQNVAIPCLLFRSISQFDLSATFDFDLVGAFYAGSAVCFVIGAGSARLLFRRDAADAVVFGFSSLYCNAVLLGLPLTERAFGKEVLPGNFAIIAFQAPVCYVIGITAMEVVRANGATAHKAAFNILKSLICQPNMVAIYLGLGLNLSGLVMPTIAGTTLDMMGGAGLPVSLFALGGVLVRYEVRGSLSAASFVAALSLTVRPAIVMLIGMLVFHMPQAALRSAVLTAAMAPGVNTYLFANMYGHAREVAVNAMLLGTLASIFSASLWIAILL